MEELAQVTQLNLSMLPCSIAAEHVFQLIG
jgi:hypothetical protein